jgi:hypothetical protein
MHSASLLEMPVAEIPGGDRVQPQAARLEGKPVMTGFTAR